MLFKKVRCVLIFIRKWLQENSHSPKFAISAALVIRLMTKIKTTGTVTHKAAVKASP